MPRAVHLADLNMNKPLILVDGSYFLHRTFRAIPLEYSPNGIPINAIDGSIYTIQKLIRRFRPSHMCVVFDHPDPTFRHLLSSAYKAHRSPPPEELLVQLPLLIEHLEALGIPVIVRPGMEGDDILGTLARIGNDNCMEVIISTGDKDMAQLVTNTVVLEDSFKMIVLDTMGVVNRFGVYPNQIADWLALVGDRADGIQGVNGVGKGTATDLLGHYGSLEQIKANVANIPGKVGKYLLAGLPTLDLDRKLTGIVTDLDLNLDIDDLALKPSSDVLLKDIYTKLGRSDLIRSLERNREYVDFLGSF